MRRTSHLNPLLLAVLLGPVWLSAIAQTHPTPAKAQQSLASPAPQGALASAPARPQIAADYGKLPLSFEANQGQTDPSVRFLARGSGYAVFLSSQEAVLALHPGRTEQAKIQRDGATPEGKAPDLVRMSLRGANSGIQSAGIDGLPGKVNYLTGGEPSQWHTDIPTYSKVKFAGVYPGVDLVYHGDQGRLEFDFVVAPNADPKAIQLQFGGAAKLEITPEGDLAVSTANGRTAFHKPVVYQQIGGQREPVTGSFTLAQNRVAGFKLGRYDHSQPLVIDPVLTYSTYLGGTTSNYTNAIAADNAGNAYVTGTTDSANFPRVWPGYQTTLENFGTMYVSKLNPQGTALVYSTFIGAGYVLPTGIAVDAKGDAYVVGNTPTANYPVTPGAFQTTLPAGGANHVFVTELNAKGTALVYSTFLAGNQTDSAASAIAVDSHGEAFVTGSTTSTNFPVSAGAIQSANANQYNSSNAFVSAFNATGTGLLYSTYLGGSGNKNGGDAAAGIALDSSGDAYVAGATYSTDFPVTAGAYQTTYKNLHKSSNAFVAKLNPTGTALLYSTYLGGKGAVAAGPPPYPTGDGASGIGVDSQGIAYVWGGVTSPDFPVTPGAFQTSGGVFLTAFNPDGDSLVYSAEMSDASPSQIAVDAEGDVYLAGSTDGCFPITPYANFSDSSYGLCGSGSEGFLWFAKVNPAGSTLLYSSYIWGEVGENGDTMNGIAVDSSKNVYLAGTTQGNYEPITPGALQTMNYDQNKSGDPQIPPYTPTGLVAKLALVSPGPTYPASMSLIEEGTQNQYYYPDLAFGTPLTFSASVTGSGPNNAPPTGSVWFYVNGKSPVIVPLDGNGNAAYTPPSLPYGQNTVQAIYTGDTNFAQNNASALQDIIPSLTVSPVYGGIFRGSVTLTMSTTPGASIYYTLDGTPPGLGSTKYTQPITLTAPATLVWAVAAPNGQGPSWITESSYWYYVEQLTPTPVLSLASGSYPAGQLLTIADSIPTATIRYTTDGSTPTTHSNWYHGPIVLTGSETVQAIAISTGLPESNVTSATYTIP